MSEFCWHVDDNEYSLEGPFDTLEECKKHLLGCFLFEHDAKVVIAQTKVVMPQDWATALFDMEEILARMDERICDEIAFEDCVFTVPTKYRDEAQNDLNDALRYLAISYVTANGKWSEGAVVLRTTVGDLRKQERK